MALTLIIEDGTGKPDANAYASIEEANAYFDTRPRSDAWDNLDDDAKTVLLVHAARILDSGMTWDGEPLVSTQALAFPRVIADSSVGVPATIKIANFELAIALNDTDIAADSAMAGISSIEVGPIKVTADQVRAKPTIPKFVADLVAPYGAPRGQSSNVRLFRR